MAKEVSSKDIKREILIVLVATLSMLLLPFLGVWFVKFVYWCSNSVLMWL
jgi:hypothetical protein